MSIFSKIQKTKVRSNTFDLTHDRKSTTQFGRLTPILCMDLVPGDQVSVKASLLVRLAPLIAPVMHRASVYCHFFFVPNRLVWPNWEKFITGGEDGMDTSVWPYLRLNLYNNLRVAPGSLADHLGVPTANASSNTHVEISAIPFAAYQMIYNEYYRDQNLIDPVESALVDGDNSGNTDLFTLRNRAWQHDYFTSALPWTQKGPEAMLPLMGDAPVHLDDDYPLQDPQVWKDANGGTQPVNTFMGGQQETGESRYVDAQSDPAPNPPDLDIRAYLDPNGTMYADLSQATSASINDLRRAVKLQEWLEKNARGGSRYIESISVHFGVQSSDKRLQRPEYLGGISTPVQVSEVLQTSSTDTTTPQANMAGHALAVGSGDYVSYFAEEHGYLMGIMSIMPTTAYQQGIPRHLTRADKFDYYWPEFAHIGEQAVLNKEVYVAPDSADRNDDVFGYVPRYAEYKYMNNSVHGAFKASLDFWHMGRIFDSAPNLNSDFIQMEPGEVSRIFAVETTDDPLWCHIVNEVKARRKMPVFGTPRF